MKRILFSIPYLKIGGIERSLIELLNVLPLKEYEVHLAIFNPDIIYLLSIPEEVHIHQISRPGKDILLSLMKSFHWIEACIFFCMWIYGRLFHDNNSFFRYKYRNEPDFMGGTAFDLAVAYHGSFEECCFYAFQKVKSRVKCIWIHHDVSQVNFHYEMMMRYRHDLSKVFLPCMESKKRFDKKYPCLKEKSDVFRNIIPVHRILKMAETGKTFNDNFDGKRILTVGRFRLVKGQYQAFPVFRELSVLLLLKHLQTSLRMRILL